MSSFMRSLKLLLSQIYGVAIWGTLGGLIVHAVLTSSGMLERTQDNRDATSTLTETAELFDLNTPNQP